MNQVEEFAALEPLHREEAMEARMMVHAVNVDQREAVSVVDLVRMTEEMDFRTDADAIEQVDHCEAPNDICSFIINRTITFHPHDLIRSTSSITDGTETSLIEHLPQEDSCLVSIFQHDPGNLVFVEGEILSATAIFEEDIPDPASAWNEATSNEELRLSDSNVSIPSKIINYAQLFFDPESNLLVVLMKVNLASEGTMTRYSIFEYNDWCHLHDPKGNGNPYSVTGNMHANNQLIAMQLQVQTRMTKCSSISTGNGVKGAGNLAPNNFQRYSYEPIIFSHGRQLWEEGSEVKLFLLHDRDGAWGVNIRKTSCTDTFKKFFKSSRVWLSLHRVGQSRWKAERNTAKRGAEWQAYYLVLQNT